MIRMIADPSVTKGKIHKEIYGQFAEHLGRGIYEGVFVKPDSGIPNVKGMRTDVVEALRNIKVPVIRWPGGCFADEYHWQDGIGPADKRKRTMNSNWGDVVEDNSFGTHEFFELCDQLGCEAYVNGNIGSGSVREMEEWLEYLTFTGESPMTRMRAENGHPDPFKVKFWGVGNESWGFGGNMLPEDYAALYRWYQTYLHDYQDEKALKFAVGPSGDDYEWTEKLLEKCFRRTQPAQHGLMDGLTMHHYMFLHGWDDKGQATEFTTDEWYLTMQKAYYIDEIIRKNVAIMDKYDPEKKIGFIIDEWGNWFAVEPGTNPGFLYQQNTIRDAVTAGMNLNIFNSHCDRVTLTTVAQMVNVLQSMLLTDGDKMVKTPTYHVFDLYKGHQDAELVDLSLTGTTLLGSAEEGKHAPQVPSVTATMSKQSDGTLLLTMTNQSAEDGYPVELLLEGGAYSVVRAQIIAGESAADDPHGLHEYNTFETPDRVVIKDFAGVSADASEEATNVRFTIPAASVLAVTLKKA